MDKEKAVALVVSEMGKYQKRDNIIMKLCEQTGCSWPEAEAVVCYVEREQGERVKAERSPFLLAIGIGSIGAGLLLSVGMVIATLGGWIFLPLALPIPYLGNILLFLLGLGMLTGGIVGMWSTIQSLGKR